MGCVRAHIVLPTGFLPQVTAIRKLRPGTREIAPLRVCSLGRRECGLVYREEFERLRHVATSLHHRSDLHCCDRSQNGQ